MAGTCARSWAACGSTSWPVSGSAPEILILRKVLRWPLIATFVGVVAAGILLVGYGILQTPGVAIDGKVVHSRGIPGPDKVRGWLAD